MNVLEGILDASRWITQGEMHWNQVPCLDPFVDMRVEFLLYGKEIRHEGDIDILTRQSVSFEIFNSDHVRVDITSME